MLYALYDDDDMCCFCGTSRECVKFLNQKNESVFYCAVSRGVKAAGKYTIYKIEEGEQE